MAKTKPKNECFTLLSSLLLITLTHHPLPHFPSPNKDLTDHPLCDNGGQLICLHKINKDLKDFSYFYKEMILLAGSKSAF